MLMLFFGLGDANATKSLQGSKHTKNLKDYKLSKNRTNAKALTKVHELRYSRIILFRSSFSNQTSPSCVC